MKEKEPVIVYRENNILETIKKVKFRLVGHT